MNKELENEKEKIYAFVKKYCALKGLRLNPDTRIVEIVIEGLAKNELLRGARYCPCRLVAGNPREDKNKICPCKWHKEEIERDGHCHCGLFFK